MAAHSIPVTMQLLTSQHVKKNFTHAAMRRWWRASSRSSGCFCCRQLSSAVPGTKLLRNEWQGVVGLEIHAQIITRTKLFSRSPVQHNAPPNTCITAFDLAHPGTLPVLNKRCVEAAVTTAMALQARINYVSYFDRKHYFYPDMPAGYQITQQRVPVAEDGEITFLVLPPDGRPYVHATHLERIQIEQDSGKTLHDRDNNRVFVDLNRAGVGLLELVFGPTLRNAAEAAGLVQHLRHVLLKLGVCSGRMNEGALRVDANVSVRQPGQPLGTRTEIKNINSIKFLIDAIEQEQERQVSLLEEGGEVINETRRYDPDLHTTISMRDKEGLQDYRFMPEPNLPPLRIYNSSEQLYPPPNTNSVDVSTLPRLPVLPGITSETVELLLQKLPDHWIPIMMYEPGMCKFFLSMVDYVEKNTVGDSPDIDQATVSPDRTVERNNRRNKHESSKYQNSQSEVVSEDASVAAKEHLVEHKDGGQTCQESSKFSETSQSNSKESARGHREARRPGREDFLLAAKLLRDCCIRDLKMDVDEETGESACLSPQQLWSVTWLQRQALLHPESSAAILQDIVVHRDTRTPHQIASAKGLLLITDTSVIAEAVTTVIENNKELMAKYATTRRNPKKQQRTLNKLNYQTRLRLDNCVDADYLEPLLRAALDAAIGPDIKATG